MLARIIRHGLLPFLVFFFGGFGSPAYANTLRAYVQQSVELCESAAIDRVAFGTLDDSDWRLIRRDQKDNGSAGKQFAFVFQHAKVPWLTAAISANGVDSASGVSGRICAIKYKGGRHSFDANAMSSWIDAQPAEISAEFSKQLRDLRSKLVKESYEEFEEDAIVNMNEVSLKTCEAGIRYKANIVMHDPSKNEVDAYFELRSSDWKKPC